MRILQVIFSKTESAAPKLSGPASRMSKPKLTEVVGLAYTFGNSVSPIRRVS